MTNGTQASKLSADYVRKALEDAPSVTQEQRERIARLLAPASRGAEKR